MKKEESIQGERESFISKSEFMAVFMGTLITQTIFAAMEPLVIRLQSLFWSNGQIMILWIYKSDCHRRPFITNRVEKNQPGNPFESGIRQTFSHVVLRRKSSHPQTFRETEPHGF